MRKNFLKLLIFAFIVPSVGNAQQNAHHTYDCQLAVDKLSRYLRSGENFVLFSDDYKGEEVFNTQHDVRKNLVIKCIPVLKVNNNCLGTFCINDNYINDYSCFAGFVFNRNNLASIIRSVTVLSSEKLLVGKEDGEKVAILYSRYSENDSVFFYDNSFKRFCYILNNNYYFFDVKENKFIKLGNSEMLKKKYNEYFGK